VRKRPGMADVANMVGQIGQTTNEAAPPPTSVPPEAIDETTEVPPPEQGPYWKKATAIYRSTQLSQLDNQLTRWNAEERVKMSAAEVLRLALDTMLKRMEEEPEQVILELYQQELRELEQAETRKFGRSQGAEAYLKRKKLL
jgi:hypothetical protein